MPKAENKKVSPETEVKEVPTFGGGAGGAFDAEPKPETEVQDGADTESE